MKLIVKTHFDAAHHLENYEGECANLHGHRWVLEVYIKVPESDDISLDFKDAKELINKELPDHQYLNKIYPFNPTAENIARHLKKELGKHFIVDQLILWESPTSAAVV